LSQTGCNTVSAHISIYFRYNAISGCVGDVVEPGDIENMDVGVGILFLTVLCAQIVLLPVWVTAISISDITRLPVLSTTPRKNYIDLENTGVDVEILSVEVPKLEITLEVHTPPPLAISIGLMCVKID